MTLNWNWAGYGMNAEQIAEARLVEACEGVFGKGTLPTPAMVHAVIAEIIKGTIVVGAQPNSSFPMEVTLEQYGAYSAGVMDSTKDGPAFVSAMNALAAQGGGTLKLYRHYGADGNRMTVTGDQYANIKIVGVVPGAGFYKTSNSSFGSGDFVVHIGGSGAYTLKNLTFEKITFAGFGAGTDFAQLLRMGGVDQVRVDACTWLNNGMEGLALSGHDSCSNFTVINNFATGVGAYSGQYLAAYNINSDGAIIAENRAIACGQGIEQDGKNHRILSNHFENCFFAAMVLLSTWASFPLDAGGVNIYTSANVIVSGNMFVNCGTAIEIGDSAGHTDFRFGGAGIVVPGNFGKLLIAFNSFIKCNHAFTGGSDNLNVIVFRGNYMEDAVTPDTAVVECEKGRFLVEDNVFVQGITSKWAYLVRMGSTTPANTFGVIRRNTVIGQCWTTQAFNASADVTLGYNDLDQVTTGTGYSIYSFAGDGGHTISSWIKDNDSWLVKNDSSFYYSQLQMSTMRVNGAPPAKGTWKVGDTVTNVAATGPAGWRLTAGGTFDTITAGCTISTTATSTAFTATANPGFIARYQWITIAGVTGPAQILTYDPGTGIGTLSIASDATVANGAVSYAAGTWTSISSTDASALTIAGQTAGDTLFATNGTTWARRPIGTTGQYSAVVGGLPTWVSCFPRKANQAISTNTSVSYADNADHVKLSITGTPAINVTAIPNGGYLVCDVYNATGTAAPTWTQSGNAPAAALITPGGSFPTLTPTINKHDRYAFYNNGTEIVMIVVYVNA